MALFSVVAGALTIGIGSATITTGITGLFATVSAFALNTVVGIGLNLAVQAAAGQETPTFSTQGKLQAGGDVSRSIMLGYGATAGSLVYANTWGRTNKAKNAYLTQVIAISDWLVSGFPGVWANGAIGTLLTGEADPEKGIPVSEYRVKGRDHLWFKFYDGSQTTADAFLVSKVSSAERPYSANRVGYGVAYAIVTARVSNTLWTGFPSFKFVVNGAPLYDISKDSTAGGDGPHRYDDSATWGGDGDHLPAVQIYNLARGLYYGNKWFYGMQRVSAARLPAASWIAEIAKCRATVTVEGAPQPMYRTGGELPVNAELGNAVKAILTGCSGRLSEIAGSYDLKLGAPGAATFSFSDADVISTEPQQFTPFFGLSETVTGVTGKYPNPADGWNSKACPPIYRADLEEKAGNRRLLADVPFDMVPYPAQAQRLLSATIEEAQRERRHTIVLPPNYWAKAVPGAICEWTISARNGYETKLFRVDGAVDRANLDVMIDITEVDPADHDPSVFVPPPETPVGPVVPPPEANPDFDAEGYAVPDADGGPRRPTIKAKYPGDLDDVRAEQIRVRLSGQTEIIYNYDIPYGDQDADESPMREVVLNGTFLPATAYEASGRHVPVSDRETEWSPWVPVTTPDVRLGSGDIEVTLDALKEEVREVLKGITARYNSVIERIEDLAASTAIGAGRQASQATAIVRTTNALASSFLLLDATINDDETGLSALAEAVLGVQAAVDNVSAGGLIQIIAQVPPPDGILSQINIMARATTGDDFEQSGLAIQVYDDGGTLKSRVVVLGDQFVVWDGENANAPLVYEDGILTLDVARMKRSIIKETLETSDEKVRLGVLAPGVNGMEILS